MMNNNRTTKKRKANDGRTTADNAHDDVNTGSYNFFSSWFGYFLGRRDNDGALPEQPNNENSIQQSLSQMNETMMRMEEKLATFSSLESRCEELERKCSSLENIVKSTSQSTKDRIDKTLKYHEMLIRNQKWKYTALIDTKQELMDLGNYDANAAGYIFQTSEILKDSTEAMRRGDFPDVAVYELDDMGISLDIRIDVEDDLLPFDEVVDYELAPHWEEFAAALKQFKPVVDMLPDDCKTFISFTNLQLNRENSQRIIDALMSTPFKCFRFRQNCHFHGGMSTITAMMGINTHLQQLKLYRNQDMDRNDIAALSSAIQRHPSLVDITICECFSDGLGDDMLRLLLNGGDLKLKRLDMTRNHLLGSRAGPNNACTVLADFLATNPCLTHLDLSDNRLNDNDAELIANALRSNTTLRSVDFSRNHTSTAGVDLLELALYDKSSLNSAADSNHSCLVMYVDNFYMLVNDSIVREVNRAKKIYRILSSRNETMSNVQHFGDIDVKLLPNMLETVEKYSRLAEDDDHVETLSVV